MSSRMSKSLTVVVFVSALFSDPWNVAESSLSNKLEEESEIASLFKKSASEILAGLEAAGISHLGSKGLPSATSVRKLREQAAQVRYVEMNSLIKPHGALRHTAFYETSTKTVYINIQSKIPSSVLKPLALHETLGALGYHDIDYQASFSAYLIADKYAQPKTEIEKFSRKALEDALRSAWYLNEHPDRIEKSQHQPDQLLLRSGGANGVGGGGDGSSLSYKAILISALTSDDELIMPEALWQTALNLQIEISTDPSQKEISYSWVQLGRTKEELEDHLKNIDPTLHKVALSLEKIKRILRIVVPHKIANPILEGALVKKDPGLQDILFFLKSILPSKLKGDIRYNCKISNYMDIMFATYRPRENLHPAAIQLMPERIRLSESRYQKCLQAGALEVLD